MTDRWVRERDDDGRSVAGGSSLQLTAPRTVATGALMLSEGLGQPQRLSVGLSYLSDSPWHELPSEHASTKPATRETLYHKQLRPKKPFPELWT